MVSELRIIVISLFSLLIPLASCTSQQTQGKTEKLQLTVSIAPQKYFVEKIGRDYVQVNVMVLPGADPHTYEPKPEQLRSLAQSQAYFSIGDSFEQAWLKRLTSLNPQLLLVDTSQGIKRIAALEDEHHHQEKETEEHLETGLDPHIWLSPKLVKIQAQHIYETILKLDPQREPEYKQNLAMFLGDLDQLDAEIRQNLAEIKQRKFMVFHPAWAYFAQEYNLEMIPIEIDGQEPSASELAALISRAKKENIKVIFAQPEFSSRAAETIAKEIDGQVILISNLTEDWEDNLRSISQKFAEILSKINRQYLLV